MAMISPAYAKICAHYLSGERPAFATTLVAILLRCYGAEILNWDSWSLSKQIEDDFHVELDRKTHDKIQALITSLGTTQVYQDAETFGHVVNSLNGKGISVYGGPPTPEDVAWGIAELELADPQPEGLPKDRWSRAIKGYIRVVLDDAGLTIKPKSLSMAAERPGSLGSTMDATTYAGGWESHQKMADEVDQIVSKRMDKLLEQLRAVGIPVQVKQASVEQTAPDVTKALPAGAPMDEGWVKSSASDDDRRGSLLHEVVEMAMMRQGALDRTEGQGKKAEWTSESNMATHVAKHSGEFGGPEEYLKAEKEHSESPPADQIPRNVRCRPGRDGKMICATAYSSASKGTIHVRTLEDGRTVTLFKAD